MHEHFNAATWLVDRHVAEGRGDRLAVISGDRTWTYAEVADEVARAAAALRALGIGPEQRVAVAMLDSIEFVSVFLGAMRIGAVPVAMNPLLPGRDLAVITADARATLVVVSAPVADRVGGLCADAPEVATVVTTGRGDDVDTAGATVDVVGWDRFLAGADGVDAAPYPTWAESPGFWLCTSGSTGGPKLAAHRHGDIRVTCDTYADRVLTIGPDDRCFSVGPMFHAYGLGNSMSFPFAVGASTVLEPTRPPTPDLVADLVTTHRPTLFFCIPTFYAALNGSGLADDTFASVRLAASAAEPLPAETFQRFRDRFGVTILDGIGSTELLHIYLSNSPTELRPGTSGKPVPGYGVRVVDEEGNDQPTGEPGQLLARGESMTTGYWCRTDTNRSTFEGPWMRTGDLYVVDEDGFHTYLGRVDDMLRVGGEWVSPAEVEGALIEHDSVLEAAVVGERDERGILRPIAFVIPAGGTDGVDGAALSEELTGFCRDRLAGYKRPRRYEIVAELPKTATGKIQRFKLRA
jgi:benzoate-CoA ligase family protein